MNMSIQKYFNTGIRTGLRLLLLTMPMVIASCDDHEHLDTAIHIGHVVCSDGRTMSVEECEKMQKEPVAVVFYVSADGKDGDGLAIGLQELAPVEFSDTLGVAQGTSASTDEKDGNANTYSLYSNNKAGSPLADAVFSVWRYGQSAYIPSVAEMRLLNASLPAVNSVLRRCGGDAISEDAGGCWYWTSTEVSGQAGAKAWLYSLGTGAIQETPKTEAHPARIIITLRK